MSLKLSAGCTCCPVNSCAVCTASPPAEYDVTLVGFSNDSSDRCTGCSNLDDIYTLSHEAIPSGVYDCSWKYEATAHSGGHYASCDAGLVEVFISEIYLGLTRTVIGLQTRFTWQIYIITTGSGGAVGSYGDWHKEYDIWLSGEVATTSCDLTYLFENLLSSGPATFCRATNGTTTADVEVG
tara:strand:- start:99 stop:644 length:546 start_codon:yes stop_codon:yes gene_type:complete